MTEETQEWVTKAEADWEDLNSLRNVPGRTHFDSICFHAQQSVEKYLKAILIEADVVFPKTHNLSELLDLVLPLHTDWEQFRTALETLSHYAVVIRYPGFRVTSEIAEEAYQICETRRAVLRPALGLDN